MKRANHLDGILGANIRERRQDLNMTSKELGDLIGLTFQQIQKYERGINRVSAITALLISEALKIELPALFKGCYFDATVNRVRHDAARLRQHKAERERERVV